MLRLLLFLSFLTSSIVNAQKDAEKKYRKAILDSRMVFMDSGTVYLKDHSGDVDVPFYPSPEPTMFKVRPFYICAYEVCNFDYIEYLYWKNRNDYEHYAAALPDTAVWSRRPMYNEPYVEYYFRHPAYRYYPLVGVTHQQAIDYCAWLTDRYNENPDRKHKKVRFRLPTKNEWLYAALSGAEYREPEKGKTTAIVYRAYNSIFPWGEVIRGLPNSMQDKTGSWMANFKPIDQSSVQYVKDAKLIYKGDTIRNNFYIGSSGSNYMGMPDNLNDNSDITAPVFSYFPGLSGLYNMAGNIEEMVAEYGITKGGSWNDTGYYLQNTTEETYDAATETNTFRGFRVAMEVIEEF
ncbi:MAG: SUMF1/EgtB/PvdO family nonheme iron enzyme [Bacteroidota bacterium]